MRTAAGRRREAVAGALLLLALFLCAAEAASEPPKTVLALFEETRVLPAVAETDDAIRATLHAGSTSPIRLYTEYLGLSWFPEEARELALRDLLQKTYATRRPDVVIAWGTGALTFALRHRARLFDGVPIVFCAVDPALLPPLAVGSGVTGVSRRIDWVPSLELIRRLHPETREVAIVTGAGAVDLRWEAEARRALGDHRDGVKVTYLARQPMPQLLDGVASLSPQTVILYGAVLQDGAGRPYLPREALILVARAARVPIYAVTENMLGHGVVGGRFLDFASQGVTAARLALRTLGGERLGPADVVEADNPFLFDWRQLQRWGIDERRLPPDSEVRFRERSIWDLYKRYIVATAVVIATQSLLIAALLVQRARRQRAEDEARARREALAHAQRVVTVGQLSASLAHEINQPLTAITTNAQAAGRLLAAAPTDGDELTETLADIARDATRAGAIVHRLRALVRKQPGERQPVDLNAAIAEVTRILRRDLTLVDVSLQLHLDAALPPVLGDVVQLQQVVLNLLLNACQAMSNGEGPRVLRIETSEPDAATVAITVTDSGAGIPPAELERMFELFASSKTTGLGMGLWITRAIVEAHGGRIWATRNPERGLTLHVRLPRARTDGRVEAPAP